jgi:multidrug resistance efflux pump
VNQDDVSDELSQLKLSLKVAEDKHRDSVRNLEAEEIKLGLLVVAPRNGQVTTILGQVGNPVSPNSQLVVLDSNED